MSGGTISLSNGVTVTGNISAANATAASGNILQIGTKAAITGNMDVKGNIIHR